MQLRAIEFTSRPDFPDATLSNSHNPASLQGWLFPPSSSTSKYNFILGVISASCLRLRMPNIPATIFTCSHTVKANSTSSELTAYHNLYLHRLH